MQRQLISRRQFCQKVAVSAAGLTLPGLFLPGGLMSAEFGSHQNCPLSKIAGIDGEDINSVKGKDGVDKEVPPSATCTETYAHTTGTNGPLSISNYNTHDYAGIIWDDGLAGEFCDLYWHVYDKTGTITGIHFVMEVWEINPSTYASVSFVGRSQAVLGNAGWSNQLVQFPLSSNIAYDCTGTKKYGILLKTILSTDAITTYGKTYVGDSLPGYIRTFYTNDAGTPEPPNEGFARWSESGGNLTVVSGTYQQYDYPRMKVSTMV